MEAKDTVLGKRAMDKIIFSHTTEDKYIRIAEEQAQISFKAGQKEERERIVEAYTRYHDIMAPVELKKIMLDG